MGLSVSNIKVIGYRPVDVAIVMTCHQTYFQHITRVLESIDSQNTKFSQKILVLDNVVSDTSSIPKDWTVLKVGFGNPNSARNEGLGKVRHKWVMFWDGDNTMPELYLSGMVSHITNAERNVAFIYPNINYVNWSGSVEKYVRVPEWDYWVQREKTFIDTSSLWRTHAIRTVGGWSEVQVGHDDYELSLRLTRAGWTGKKSSVFTSLTLHDQKRSKNAKTDGSIWTAYTLGIVTLWGGKSKVVDRLLKWYQDEEFPPYTSLYWVENGDVEDVRLKEHVKSLCNKFKNISLTSSRGSYKPSSEGEEYLVWERHQHVANLYNAVIPRVNEDLLLFVEDDCIPPMGGLRKLHDCIKPWGGVALVGGAYASRTSPEHACASVRTAFWGDSPKLESLPEEPIQVGMIGGGFTLAGNWALKKALPFECNRHPANNSLTGWDGNLGICLNKLGYRAYLHGGVKVEHCFS